MSLKIKMQATTILSFLALIGGIILYLGWSLHYDVWTDIGLYSITSILIISGALGLFLSFYKEDGKQKSVRKR